MSCLELLVTLKAIDLNMRDRIDQDTPLHKAVQYKEDYDIAIAMVDQLLEAGADPRYFLYTTLVHVGQGCSRILVL